MTNSPKQEGLIKNAARQRIKEFLQKNPTGALALTDAKNNPVTWIVNYCIDDEFSVLFATDPDSKTIQDLESKDCVQLVVYDSSPHHNVKITGKPVKVTDLNESHAAFYKTLKASQANDKSSNMVAGHYSIFKIKPTKIHVSLPKLLANANFGMKSQDSFLIEMA